MLRRKANPRARFFAFMFPILLLVIFSSVLGAREDNCRRRHPRVSLPLLRRRRHRHVDHHRGLRRVGYGIGFSVGSLAAMALAAIVGTLTFACLGFAVAGLIGSPDAAQPIVQATMLPLYFISGVGIPIASLPATLRHIADVFPIKHLAQALHLASVRGSLANALAPRDLLVLAAWAVAASVFAARRFRWLPVAASA